jgi:hypothetical protein
MGGLMALWVGSNLFDTELRRKHSTSKRSHRKKYEEDDRVQENYEHSD